MITPAADHSTSGQMSATHPFGPLPAWHDVVGNPALRGRLEYRRRHGDPDAGALLDEINAAWADLAAQAT